MKYFTNARLDILAAPAVAGSDFLRKSYAGQEVALQGRLANLNFQGTIEIS